ncbi:MAG: iron chaperone [Bacteroidia bacterium]
MDPIETYISTFPKEVQQILRSIRSTIHKTAPEAEESMAYGMPAYKMNGKPLVYFAAYPHHIGFYATPTGHEKFATELSQYKQGKGSVQFPLDKPIPYDLIERIVAFRVQENLAKRKN